MKLTSRVKHTLSLMAALALGLMFTGVQAAWAQQPASGTYTTIDFPGAAGTIVPPSFALNLGTSGQFVGCYFNTPNGMVHGFLLNQGTFTTIDFPGSLFTELSGINPQGDIVGNYVDPTSLRVHVLLLRLGSFTTIDFPGAFFTFSASISPEGDIAGGYFDTSFNLHGYVLSQGTFTKVDFPGAMFTAAFGVNPAGTIVGAYADAQFKVHGFVLSNGSFTTLDFPGAVASGFACGPPYGGGTTALGINPLGDIVGSYCGTDGNDHGFLLSNGNFRTVNFPGATFTFANGINPEGEIGGGYQLAADGTYHGFVLGSSGVSIQIASSATSTRTNESPQVSPPNAIHKPVPAGLDFGKFGWLRRWQWSSPRATLDDAPGLPRSWTAN
jgi:uncharacterized membrane protein